MNTACAHPRKGLRVDGDWFVVCPKCGERIGEVKALTPVRVLAVGGGKSTYKPDPKPTRKGGK